MKHANSGIAASPELNRAASRLAVASNATAVNRRGALLALAALPLATHATTPVALPPELISELPLARLMGEARMTFFGLQVYDIRLWGADPSVLTSPAQATLALELQYARSLSGQRIAERSLQEMRGLEPVDSVNAARWLGRMQQLFPDVAKGDRITGLQLAGKVARFFANGSLRGEVRDADFTRLFFGIWLSPRSSEPELRKALLGRAATGS